jgi:hypothetical protein
MVKALHGAGIEVILDVVYNHTAEGAPPRAAATIGTPSPRCRARRVCTLALLLQRLLQTLLRTSARAARPPPTRPQPTTATPTRSLSAASTRARTTSRTLRAIC